MKERERKVVDIYKGIWRYYKFAILVRLASPFKNGLRLIKWKPASKNCPHTGMELASRKNANAAFNGKDKSHNDLIRIDQRCIKYRMNANLHIEDQI